MFKNLLKLRIHILVSTLVLIGFAPMAHAGAVSYLGDLTLGFANNVASMTFQIVLYIMHYWVMLTAALFSTSINMNLHIKDFVDAAPGIYSVWQTIRDISSIFIIFMLLYASIKLILSQEDGIGSVGNLIKNIIIGGILINFSFFITSLLIDGSNMISLAIYKGIVGTDPTLNTSKFSYGSQCLTSTDKSKSAVDCMTENTLKTKDASLADFFQTKLAPQSAYNVKLSTTIQQDSRGSSTTDLAFANDPAPLRTIIQGFVGVIIMAATGFSFLFASAAFAVRLVVLVVLLAFSSVWFAAMIFPSLKDESKKFADLLRGQLIFMPVYMLLLYGALVVLNKSTIFAVQGNTGGFGSGAAEWFTSYINLFISDFFIIFLLNLPLVTALGFASSTTKWLGADKFSAEKIWKGIGSGAGSWFGRNTAGRAAHIAKNSSVMNKVSAWSPSIGGTINKRLGKIENAGFGVKKGGFKDVNEAKQKDYKAEYERINKVDKDAGKRYLENLEKGTILSRLYDNSAKITKGVGQVAVGASVIMGDKSHPAAKVASSILGSFGESAVNLGEKGAKVSTTLKFGMAEKKAAEVLKKQKDEESTSEDAKKAQDEMNKLNLSNLQQKNVMDKNISDLDTSIKDLRDEFDGINTSIEKLTSEIKAADSQKQLLDANGRPMRSTVALQKESEMQTLKGRLEMIGNEILGAEKKKRAALDEKSNQQRNYNEEFMKLQQRVNAGKKVQEGKFNKEVLEKLGKLEEKGGEGGGGGGKKEEKKE